MTATVVKLVALDLDGTLVNKRGEITERSVRAIKDFKDRTGAWIVICTGRETASTKPAFDALDGAADFAVLTNGAMVRDARWQVRTYRLSRAYRVRI